MTPSYAKNSVRKALITLIDPNPGKGDVRRLWEHFRSSCAFCGLELRRDDRNGHKDHLVPSSRGGRNHVSNRVLACRTCNGDEKLDKDWKEFLRNHPGGTADEKRKRKQRILKWCDKNLANCSVEDEHVARAIEAARRVMEVFDEACNAIRQLQAGKGQLPTH